MGTSDIAPALMVGCFALLILAASQLVKIQIEAIGHARHVSRAEARRIYYRDYTDGDGAEFRWSEMRRYCASTGAMARLRLWVATTVIAVAGGFGSVFLDQALR